MRALATQLRGGAARRRDRAPDPRMSSISASAARSSGRAWSATRSRAPARAPVSVSIVAFVSNVDPEHLTRALAGLDPATTLFVVTSKTFTTSETMRNARSARDWLAAALGGGPALATHFIAVTANTDAARTFGVAGADVLPIWPWVGGRFSLWSAAGLPIAIRCGWDRYAELLAGAASMDAHFRTTEFERNLPVLLALDRLLECATARSRPARRRAVRAGALAHARLPAAAGAGEQRQIGSARRRAARRAQRTRRLGRTRHATASTRFSSGCTRARTRSRSNSSFPCAPRIRSPISRACSSPTRSRRRRR